jgi:hypothetical protein
MFFNPLKNITLHSIIEHWRLKKSPAKPAGAIFLSSRQVWRTSQSSAALQS